MSAGSSRIVQLFSYPFRIFFFSVASWALLVVPLWLLQLLAPLQLPLAWPALHWHQYEMLFGLLNAAIAGFLLTAVGNWTNTRSLSGAPLFGLWMVWLAGRLLLLFGDGLPLWLVALPDLLFLPLLMLDAGRRIVAVKQWRQLPVLSVLLLLWILQCAFRTAPAGLFSSAALVVAMALMTIIGGRITPAFSNNWLRVRGEQPVPDSPSWLDIAAPLALVLLLPALLWQLSALAIPLACIAALLSLWRLRMWRGWRVAAEPLLWVLHLSLLWIPLSLLLLAGALAGWWPAVVWQHAAGIGAMTSLIFGVMSRVALGHTGRPLTLPPGICTAFIALQLTALLRVVTAFGLIEWRTGVVVSALLWMLAFALFLWRYTGILTSPRPDGKPG